MNTKVTNDMRTISVALLSGLLIIVATMMVVEPQEVRSQNVTDIFTLPSESTQNQTQMAPNQTQMVLANLTRADMEPVTGALNSTREAILGNSSQDAYTSLNDADDALFRIAQGEGPSAVITIIKITEPMRTHIEGAQKALLVGDLPKAMDERNSAEVELVRIIQGLPAGEEVTPVGEEEPPSDEEEPPSDEEE
jgi:hypothetical protein